MIEFLRLVCNVGIFRKAEQLCAVRGKAVEQNRTGVPGLTDGTVICLIRSVVCRARSIQLGSESEKLKLRLEYADAESIQLILALCRVEALIQSFYSTEQRLRSEQLGQIAIRAVSDKLLPKRQILRRNAGRRTTSDALPDSIVSRRRSSVTSAGRRRRGSVVLRML